MIAELMASSQHLVACHVWISEKEEEKVMKPVAFC
jgi:hypothetical protein